MEHITLFTLDNPEIALSAEREIFYDERRTTYANHYLYVIDVLLFNSYGEIMLQKRSRRKKKNP
jgi:isopentenyldiphosphate isomerase